jgi:hypothetical protein
MKEQLPKYTIDGKDYWVDLRKNEFRSVEWEKVTIPFELLTPSNHGYYLIYDQAYDCHTNDFGLTKINGKGSITEIPPLHQLDPIGMERMYGVWGGPWENVNDTDWIIQSFLKNKNLDGNRPTLLLDGDEYTLDETGKLLVPHHKSKRSLTKENFFYFEVSTKSMEFFDLVNQKMIRLNKDLSFKKMLPPYCIRIGLNHTKHERMFNDRRSRPKKLRKGPRVEKVITKESANQILSGYAVVNIFALACRSEFRKSNSKKRLIYRVDHTDFEVNLAENCIQASNNGTNRIYFHQMNYMGGSYEFRFDRVLQRQAAPFDTNEQDISIERIPGKNVLDPEYMADRYNVRLESVAGSNDFEIMVGKEYLKRRMDGELPKIRGVYRSPSEARSEIKGLANEYLVDFKSGLLIAQKDGCPDIRLPPIYDFQSPVIFLYDLKENKVTEITSQGQAYIDEHIVGLRFPSPIEIDPFYSANHLDWDIETTLLKYPPDHSNLLLTYRPISLTQKLNAEDKKLNEKKNIIKGSKRRSL